MQFKNLLLISLFLFSILLIGGGVTGKVVSESCCLEPFCKSENICSFADNNPFDTDNISLYLGLGLFVSTAGTYVFINRKESSVDDITDKKT